MIAATKAPREPADEEPKPEPEPPTDGDDAPEPTVTTTDEPAKPKRESDVLKDLTVDELLALYATEIGRPTGRTDRGYLIWKIREARKGKITVGLSKRKKRDPSVKVMTLPLRMDEPVVNAMDEAWKRLGIKSRTAFVWEALAAKLEAEGEGRASRGDTRCVRGQDGASRGCLRVASACFGI